MLTEALPALGASLSREAHEPWRHDLPLGEGEAACCLAGGVGGQRHQARGHAAGGTPRVEAGDDLIHRHHGLGPPRAAGSEGRGLLERHELDEAHDHALAAGELGERLDLRFVESTQQDAVDLDWAQANGTRGTNAGELGLTDPAAPHDQLIAAMVREPILVERPIVVTSNGAVLCRPVEKVLTVI